MTRYFFSDRGRPRAWNLCISMSKFALTEVHYIFVLENIRFSQFLTSVFPQTLIFTNVSLTATNFSRSAMNLNRNHFVPVKNHQWYLKPISLREKRISHFQGAEIKTETISIHSRQSSQRIERGRAGKKKHWGARGQYFSCFLSSTFFFFSVNTYRPDL